MFRCVWSPSCDDTMPDATFSKYYLKLHLFLNLENIFCYKLNVKSHAAFDDHSTAVRRDNAHNFEIISDVILM